MNFLKMISFMMAGVVFSGCQSRPQADLVSKSYLASSPLCLKVGQIDIANPAMRVEGQKTSLYAPLKSLASELKTWAVTRFTSCGGVPRARVSFPGVEIYQTSEPSKELFRQGRDLFSLGITAQVEILDEHGFPLSLVHASVNLETSLSESLSLEEREKKLEQVKTRSLNALDQEMTVQVNKNLSRYVK